MSEGRRRYVEPRSYHEEAVIGGRRVRAGELAGHANRGADAMEARALAILEGLSPFDRAALIDYSVKELRRIGACGRR